MLNVNYVNIFLSKYNDTIIDNFVLNMLCESIENIMDIIDIISIDNNIKYKDKIYNIINTINSNIYDTYNTYKFNKVISTINKDNSFKIEIDFSTDIIEDNKKIKYDNIHNTVYKCNNTNIVNINSNILNTNTVYNDNVLPGINISCNDVNNIDNINSITNITNDILIYKDIIDSNILNITNVYNNDVYYDYINNIYNSYDIPYILYKRYQCKICTLRYNKNSELTKHINSNICNTYNYNTYNIKRRNIFNIHNSNINSNNNLYSNNINSSNINNNNVYDMFINKINSEYSIQYYYLITYKHITCNRCMKKIAVRYDSNRDRWYLEDGVIAGKIYMHKECSNI